MSDIKMSLDGLKSGLELVNLKINRKKRFNLESKDKKMERNGQGPVTCGV